MPDEVLRRFLLARSRLLELPRHVGAGLSPSETAVLGELAGETGLSQQQLGERLGLEKSTVSRLAAAMEGRGWLVRERDPADRRCYRLRLTPRGQDLARRVRADVHGHHRRLLGALTDEERAALTVGLSALTRVLDEEAANRHPT